jgi:hypothetical protein
MVRQGHRSSRWEQPARGCLRRYYVAKDGLVFAVANRGLVYDAAGRARCLSIAPCREPTMQACTQQSMNRDLPATGCVATPLPELALADLPL